jgi:hypothetical protein
MKKLAILILFVTARTTWSGTLGLWKESPIYVSDGMLKTLEQAGWKTVIIERADLVDGAKLNDLDVIFLPGGWNAYAFAGFKARRNLVRFVASGKGLFTGYARTANRPLFPMVGAAAHLVRASVITAEGESDLAKVIESPINTAGLFRPSTIFPINLHQQTARSGSSVRCPRPWWAWIRVGSAPCCSFLVGQASASLARSSHRIRRGRW